MVHAPEWEGRPAQIGWPTKPPTQREMITMANTRKPSAPAFDVNDPAFQAILAEMIAKALAAAKTEEKAATKAETTSKVHDGPSVASPTSCFWTRASRSLHSSNRSPS
jgi:hypothetical protein